MRHTLLFLLLSGWLFSCQSEPATRTPPSSAARGVAPMDTLVNAFLRHAHDAAETESDTLVSQLRRALQAQGVDTILYFRSGCAGCERMLNPGQPDCSCSTEEIRSYLFWQHHGHTWMKELDCCRNHPVVPTSAAPWTYYFQHQKVFAERDTFYQNRSPGHFLPPSPVHDGEVSTIQIRAGQHEQEVYVRSAEYDSLGTPLHLDYPWRRAQWKWVRELQRLTTPTNAGTNLHK